MSDYNEASAVIISSQDIKAALSVGNYSLSRLQELGLKEAPLSSIQVAKGFQAVIYAEDHFKGDSRVLNGEPVLENIMLKKGNPLLKIASMRVLAPSVLEADDHDSQAIQHALDGWWPQSLVNMENRLAWWREARLGCFIHWGVYSITGGRWKGEKSQGYAEHLMRAKKIGHKEYKEAFIDKFSPEHFDAEAWVRLIKAAGMKYVVITAKHHDGFSMYPSDAYPFDIRMTPFQRDPLLELKEACARHGMKYGFYYSHAFDWEHPDAPGNDWEYTNPGGDLRLYEGDGKLWHSEHPELLPRTANYYVDQKAIPQILELIRVYEPDILWFDTPHKLPLSENLKILEAIREADDRVVVNGRLAAGRGFYTFADYVNTADRALEIFPCEGDWESIPTTNESYGYSIDDHSHKPASAFIELLAKSAARGGNMLMNLGPKGNGEIDERDTPILQEIGAWLAVNGDSIYGTSRTPLEVQQWGESTKKANKLYLHVFQWPKDGELVLGGLMNVIRKAWLLSDQEQKPLETKRLNYYDWLIHVPLMAPDSTNSVIAVEVDGEIRTHAGRLLSEKGINVLRSFDAEVSQGMKYGDGKKGNDYICNWTSLNQRVIWKVRLNHSMKTRLSLTYSTAEAVDAGVVRIALGDETMEKRVKRTESPKETATLACEFVISAGEHDLSITPVQMEGKELMRLYSVTLAPLDLYDNLGKSFAECDATDVGD
ncbi:alpha-L-fucosidase [Paenibacillus sp. FJAT-27812]|uniref:alpha-L-fucosidase n=1 Tax=Paenibacillus sp. FJAT-27812 TaxID=1684143 RepID=UPI0006A79C90|nr:alpha-L-fucosidase [Paenibacillus sp. FJAT-27812]